MRAPGYIILIAALCFLLTGCVVVSLYPYYTDDAIIQYPEAEGTWELVRIGEDEEDSAIGSIWRFYGILLEITDTEKAGGARSLLGATFFRVGDTVLMDTTARPLDEQKEPGLSNWWAMHTLPIHLLSKAEVEGETLTITPVNYQWLKERLEAGDVELDYVVVDGLEVFTTAPETWMEFLEKYHDTEELYLKESAYVLERREAPPEEETKPEEEPGKQEMKYAPPLKEESSG